MRTETSTDRPPKPVESFDSFAADDDGCGDETGRRQRRPRPPHENRKAMVTAKWRPCHPLTDGLTRLASSRCKAAENMAALEIPLR